jgi:hypothetical protein
MKVHHHRASSTVARMCIAMPSVRLVRMWSSARILLRAEQRDG